jgi:hypothetical protein
VTGPATSTQPSTPAASYASTPATSYASTPATSYASTPATSYASTPAASYASTASTPAATLAASYASTQASTPASTPSSTAAASNTGDYVSGEQYRYALTNFVRKCNQKYHLTLPLTLLPIPHMDSDVRIRLGHRTSEGRGTAVPARRAGTADRTAPSSHSNARGFIILQPIRRRRACRRRKLRRRFLHQGTPLRTMILPSTDT